MLSGNRTCILWLLGAALLLPRPDFALAQQVKKPAAAEPAKKDPNIALKALDAGSKAYTSGKLDTAVEQLTAALANGGLPPPKMAQAYYYRGLTYKKQKKPAQALSDLTVAVWVKGGLTDADRAAAMDARNQVYREAGLGDQAPAVATAIAPAAPAPTPAAPATPPPAAAAATPAPATTPAPVATPAPAQPVAPVVAAAPPPAAPAPAAPPTERPVWQAEANSTPPPPMPLPVDTSAPPPPAASSPPSVAQAPAPPPPSTASTSAADDAYRPPPPQAPVATAEPAQAPQSTGSDMMAPIAGAGKQISGFFSNMFGGGSSEQPAPASPPATTGSTGGSGYGWVPADQASPRGPVAQVSASEPQRAPGWDAAASEASPSTQVAAKASPEAAPRTSVSASGKYRLQLASVRSREEADRLVQTVMSQHADQLGGASAEVDETVIGNMGTFYRVRVGPYANANDPKRLCTTLKPQGYDCQVVTQ